MGKIVDRLKARIDAQRALIDRKLVGSKIPEIAKYYWGTAKVGACGIAAGPNENYPLLAQLLATPRLIVDIHPLPRGDFISRYGVTPKQMQILADEEFVIPNMYFYKNEGWRQYARYRDVAELLITYGRPNSEWISGYLDKRYRFNRSEQKNAEFLRNLRTDAAERRRMIAQTNGRTQDWATFCAVYGMRFTYVEVLGSKTYPGLTDSIRDDFNTPGRRIDAVRAVNATYFLTAKTMTAAYGAKAILTPVDLTEISASLPLLKKFTLLGSGEPSPTARSVGAVTPEPGAVRYLAHLAKRVSNFNQNHEVSAYSRSFGELDDAQFESFRKALWAVRDGRVGRMVDQMTTALSRGDDAFNRTVRGYRELEKELNARLRLLNPLGTFLGKSGSMLLTGSGRADEALPEGTHESHENLIVIFVGGTLRFAEAILSDVEFTHQFWAPYPHRLLGDWRAVRDALQLSVSADS